ncbi:MAG TPA: hypothetical protein VLQ45_27920 [Thermoanaerobaculia bacterium]|jgi:hypothetical protein|nr:hypothetical protein [Thermoanaerobaculia bacterium]
MAWINATTLDGKNANFQTTQIAAILDRVAGDPRQGSVVILAASNAHPLEVRESPAELLRAIDTGVHPENAPAQPDIW